MNPLWLAVYVFSLIPALDNVTACLIRACIADTHHEMTVALTELVEARNGRR